MMTYETYKDSGIEWLGATPEHWETIRVKDLFTQISLSSSEISNKGYVPLENIESFTGKIIRRSSNENGETASLFKANDILFNKLRPYLGKVFIPDFHGGVSGEVVVFRSSNSLWKKRVNTRYFFYRFLSTKFIFKVNSLSDGVKMPRTNPAKISNLEVGLPPLIEQQAIAQYLDAKTQAIDKKVKLLEQKIDFYKELRKSLINDAVTKGLDKSVELKDSGIDWICQIPEHWEVIRIKDFTYLKARIGWQGLRSDEFVDNTDWFCVTGTDFHNGEIDWTNCYCVEQDRYDQDPKIQLELGDLLITKDGSIGKLALVKTLPKKATLNSGVFVSRPKRQKYSNDFMFWILSSGVFTDFNDYMKNGTTILHLYQNVFERFTYCLPPKQEQSQIAEYLNHKTGTIDKIVQNITDQIDQLKELRKTLINNVVTGKIRVSEPVLKATAL